MSAGEHEVEHLAHAAASAASAAAFGGEDDLIILRRDCPTIPGEQDDDGVRAVAAIDVLRYLVEGYEDMQDQQSDGANSLRDHEAKGELA